MLRGLTTATVAAVALAVPAQAAEREASSPESVAGNGEVVPGEVIVRFEPAAAGARSDALAALDATVAERLLLPGTRVLELDRGVGVRAAVRELEGMPGVAYAEPNGIARIALVPNDTAFAPDQWGLRNTAQPIQGVPGTAGADIDAAAAWDVTTGDQQVTVAVVDSGLATQHPDIGPNVRANPGESGSGKETNGLDDDLNGFVDDAVGWDFRSNDRIPADLNGHGTHVAGTVGAQGNNALGTAGVAWDVGLMPLRVTTAAGTADNADIADAFFYAGENGADIVNASLGGGVFSQAVTDAVAAAPETLFVVAAGNGGADGVGDDNDTAPTFPCNITLPNLICVASTTKTDALSGFSNFGDSSVDLAAPGSQIRSSFPRDRVNPEFADGFETDIGATGWTTGLLSGTANSWGRTSLFSFSGSFSLADSPAGDYVAGTDSFARSPAIDLTGEVDCTVEGVVKTDMGEGFVSFGPPLDGDTVLIETFDGATWATALRISGDFAELDFSADASRLDNLSGTAVRFALLSDGDATVGDGAYFDDVEVVCYGPFISFLSGTSMASPHVAGVAALLLSHRPAATVAALRGALLNGVDELPSLQGQVATGGRLSALGALTFLDDERPVAQINSAPRNRIRTTKRRVRVTFGFGANEAGATFECRLDAGAAVPCSGSKSYRVKPGSHTFRVVASDQLGAGPPATDSFRVIRKR